MRKIAILCAILLLPAVSFASVNFPNTAPVSGLYMTKTNKLDSTTGLTVCSWMYFITGGGGGFGRILNNGQDGSTGYAFYMSTSSPDFYKLEFLNGADATAYVSSLNAVSTSTWQHACVTFNATSKLISFYVNGVLRGTASATNNLNASTAGPIIGNSNNQIRQFNGCLSNLMVWRRPLSAMEIRGQQYNFLPIGWQGLMAWFPLWGVGPVENDYGPSRLLATTTAANVATKNSCPTHPPLRIW